MLKEDFPNLFVKTKGKSRKIDAWSAKLSQSNDLDLLLSDLQRRKILSIKDKALIKDNVREILKAIALDILALREFRYIWFQHTST